MPADPTSVDIMPVVTVDFLFENAARQYFGVYNVVLGREVDNPRVTFQGHTFVGDPNTYVVVGLGTDEERLIIIPNRNIRYMASVNE